MKKISRLKCGAVLRLGDGGDLCRRHDARSDWAKPSESLQRGVGAVLRAEWAVVWSNAHGTKGHVKWTPLFGGVPSPCKQ